MAIYCPIIKENVLYLDCKDCEDTDECRKLKICGLEKDNINIENKGEPEYEKDY